MCLLDFRQKTGAKDVCWRPDIAAGRQKTRGEAANPGKCLANQLDSTRPIVAGTVQSAPGGQIDAGRLLLGHGQSGECTNSSNFCTEFHFFSRSFCYCNREQHRVFVYWSGDCWYQTICECDNRFVLSECYSNGFRFVWIVTIGRLDDDEIRYCNVLMVCDASSVASSVVFSILCCFVFD